jgi:outer membrane translocation and assembly module TamA
VRIKPSNDELKANIEGYVGSLGDRDEEALLRFSRGAEEQARKAAQALGYYQPQIDSDVKGGKTAPDTEHRPRRTGASAQRDHPHRRPGRLAQILSCAQ